MAAVLADLELPLLDVGDASLTGAAFHEAVRAAAAQGWLARMPLGVVTLDRAAGEHFLRCRTATFPGQLIAQLAGVQDGPLREEIDHNILHQDGAVHARLRRLVNPSFTPAAAERWRPAVRALLEQLWQAMAGSCEFVDAVAGPLPALTIAQLVGAPPQDAPALRRWSRVVQGQFDAPYLLAERTAIEAAVVELVAWCRALLAHRRGEAADGGDVLSALLRGQDGDRLEDVEVVHLLLDVLIGGIDTTQAQLAHALRLFAEAPQQWDRLRADPSLVPRAVEEVLRVEPITPFTARVLTADVTYRDVLFPAGTVVLVGAVTGNLDGAGSPALDLAADRAGTRLLTFGAGIHHCLGANLARVELQEALAFLAPRMPGLRLTAPPVHGTVQGIYGLDALHLAWDAP